MAQAHVHFVVCRFACQGTSMGKSQRTRVCSFCYFKQECFGAIDGAKRHFGSNLISVGDECNGSVQIAVCDTAKYLIHRTSLLEYQAMMNDRARRHLTFQKTVKTKASKETSSGSVTLCEPEIKKRGRPRKVQVVPLSHAHTNAWNRTCTRAADISAVCMIYLIGCWWGYIARLCVLTAKKKLILTSCSRINCIHVFR